MNLLDINEIKKLNDFQLIDTIQFVLDQKERVNDLKNYNLGLLVEEGVRRNLVKPSVVSRAVRTS